MGIETEGARQHDGPAVNQNQTSHTSLAQVCASVEDGWRGSGPPGGTNDGGAGGGPGRTYETDLFDIAKKGATMEGDLPHPDMTGATAGDIHARSVLFPKDEAAARNAESGYEIPQYHEERAIIGYFTSIPTDDLARAHHERNQFGYWGTQSSVFGEGVSPEMVKADLNLKDLPKYYTSVELPKGSYVEASRPDSDAVRQYYFRGSNPWFGEKKTLG